MLPAKWTANVVIITQILAQMWILSLQITALPSVRLLTLGKRLTPFRLPSTTAVAATWPIALPSVPVYRVYFSVSPCIYILFRVLTLVRACFCCVPHLCRVFLFWYKAKHVFAEFRKQDNRHTGKDTAKFHFPVVILKVLYCLISQFLPNLYIHLPKVVQIMSRWWEHIRS
jgi:hypothetical protein